MKICKKCSKEKEDSQFNKGRNKCLQPLCSYINRVIKRNKLEFSYTSLIDCVPVFK